MPIPTWLTCTAADVQTDSRISPDMAQNTYDDTAFQTEITRHIGDWKNVVMSRLRRSAMQAGLITSLDDDLSTVLSDDQQKTASLALKLLVISALWQNLAGTDSNYANQANNTGLNSGASTSVEKRLTSGEGLLAELESEIMAYADANTNNTGNLGGQAVSMQLQREDEYSRCPVSVSNCGNNKFHWMR